MKKLAFFVLAGGIGFIADAGLTQLLLTWTPLGPFIARAIAMAMALCITWFINRTLTFGRSRLSVLREGFRYSVVGSVTALLNYGIYSGLLLNFDGIQPLVALALASLSAMAFSFFGYSRLVFRRKPRRSRYPQAG